MREEQEHTDRHCKKEREIGKLDVVARELKNRVDKHDDELNSFRECLINLKLAQDAKPSWSAAILITLLASITSALAVYAVTLSDGEIIETPVRWVLWML